MDSFLPPAMATQIRTVIRPRMFATMKALGNTQSLTFKRDMPDGGHVEVGTFDVLVQIGGNLGKLAGGNNETSYAGVSGNLLKEAPFPVERDDRFCLVDGPCGVITASPVATVAYLTVPFVLER